MAGFPHYFDTDILIRGALGAANLDNGTGIAQWPTQVINATLTVAPEHRGKLLLADTASAAVAITLPAAATMPNWIVVVKHAASGANALTVVPASGEKLDGGTEPIPLKPSEWAIIVCNGTDGWEMLLRTAGGSSYAAAELTAGRAITADDNGKLLVADTAAANMDLTLPKVADVGPNFVVGIKNDNKKAATPNTLKIAVDPADAGGIDGVTPCEVQENNRVYWLGVRGNGWCVLQDYNPDDVQLTTSAIGKITITDPETPVELAHGLGQTEVIATFFDATPEKNNVGLAVRVKDANTLEVCGNAGDYQYRVRI